MVTGGTHSILALGLDHPNKSCHQMDVVAPFSTSLCGFPELLDEAERVRSCTSRSRPRLVLVSTQQVRSFLPALVLRVVCSPGLSVRRVRALINDVADCCGVSRSLFWGFCENLCVVGRQALSDLLCI